MMEEKGGVPVYPVDSPRMDALSGEHRIVRDLEPVAQQSGGAVALPS